MVLNQPEMRKGRAINIKFGEDEDYRICQRYYSLRGPQTIRADDVMEFELPSETGMSRTTYYNYNSPP